MVAPFDSFVAIDWTGARGHRHHAIQAARCEAGDGAPRLLQRPTPWSRSAIARMVQEMVERGERTLVGIDCSFSLPFVDRDAYFPGDPGEPGDARQLWAEVDRICQHEEDLGAHAYILHRRRHFWCGAADGVRSPYARLRVAEAVHHDRRMGNPCSPFVLVGPSQVGKATLTGMRLLRQLGPIPIWPFDPLPRRGPCLVEIYCQTFALDGGFRGKIRTHDELRQALRRLGSRPARSLPERLSDHHSDAIVSAAGLRRAASLPAYWSPAPLTPLIAATEGWTFGIL